MGYLQEHHGLDFRWMFFIGGIFGVGTACAFSRLRLPTVTGSATPPPLGWFLRDTFSILRTNKGYRWFTASVFITGFGNLIATTYYPIYQVDQFHITPTQIANMQNIGGIAVHLRPVLLGLVHGPLRLAGDGSGGRIRQLPDARLYALEPTSAYLYVAATVMTMTSAGIDLGYLNTTLMFAEPGRAAQYQAVHSSFFGLRGTIAPLLAIPCFLPSGTTGSAPS